MRHSIFPGTSLLLAILGFLVLLLPAAAAPQEQSSDAARAISAYDLTKLQKELNEAAAGGYRISRTLPGRGLNPAANIFMTLASPSSHDTSGILLTLEKIPSGSANYEYEVIKLFARLSSWERDINAAASRGFRVVPGGTITVSRGFVLGTMGVLVTIMEKAPGGSGAAEYALVEARRMSTFGHDLNQHFADGYGVIWLGRFTDHKVALMEKRGSSLVEARLLVASEDPELQRKLRTAAEERFCIAASSTSFTGAWHGYRLAYVEKCEMPPEYAFVKNDEKARADFDKVVADGYRIVPAGVFGKTITLVKVPTDKHYEYRFVRDTREADEAKKMGFTELRLSDFIQLGGLVLEREVITVPEAPQQRH